MVIEWNFAVGETEYINNLRLKELDYFLSLSHLFVDISYDFMKLQVISGFIFHLFLPVESYDEWLISQKVHREKSTGDAGPSED